MSDDQSRINRIKRVYERIKREIDENLEIGEPWAYIDILGKDWAIVEELCDKIRASFPAEMPAVIKVDRSSQPGTPTLLTVMWDEIDE